MLKHLMMLKIIPTAVFNKFLNNYGERFSGKSEYQEGKRNVSIILWQKI